MPTTTSPRRPRLRRAAFSLLLVAALFGLASCGDDDSSGSSSGSGSGADDATSVTIGHQAFGESEILAHIYGQVLEANGFEVTYQSFKDRSAIYTAIENGDVTMLPEYAASGLEYLNANSGEATPDIDETMAAFVDRLAVRDLAAGEASAAVDTNSLVVTEATSTGKGLTSISDLTDDLKLGGPQDCPTNAGCIPALQATYGIDMTANFVPLDLGGPLTVAALENGDIDVGVLFSTDASIADKGFVVLTDDKGIFNADNVVPVGLAEFVEANAELLDEVSAALTTDNLTEMNKRYVIDKEDADAIAADFVEEHGLA